MPQIGLGLPTPAPDAQPTTALDFARRAEEMGLHSVWGIDRVVLNNQDALMALAAVAGATSRVRLGTSVLLGTLRPPLLLAKMIASLDQLSGGRFLFGVGAGWLLEEIANHGVAPRARWGVFSERMRALQTIWSSDEAEFHGRYVNFDRIWSWPKPVQKPRPPILMGGDYTAAIQRVIEFGDEWMPHQDRVAAASG